MIRPLPVIEMQGWRQLGSVLHFVHVSPTCSILTLVVYTADASDELPAVFGSGFLRQRLQDLDALFGMNDP